MLLGFFLISQTEAQVVKNERLLSFEDGEVPAYMTTDATARLTINDEHYKDGLHSLGWEYEPGAVFSVKKDLMFEKKDPTGKDLYLSAFIVWVYNEQAQDKQIRFEFLKDGKLCTSFPFGINFTVVGETVVVKDMFQSFCNLACRHKTEVKTQAS